MELALRDTSKWIVVRSNAETQTYVVYTTDDKRLCVTQELMGSRPNHSFTENGYFALLEEVSRTATDQNQPLPQAQPIGILDPNAAKLLLAQSGSGAVLGSVPMGADPTAHPLDDPGVSSSSMNSGYTISFFKIERKLGMGRDGCVFLVQHQINGVFLGYYALKKVCVGDNFESLKQVLEEVKVFEALRSHPNVVNYKHSWLEMTTNADFGPDVPTLHILMEYVDGGSLEDFLESSSTPLALIDIWSYFIDLLLGLDYLHSLGFIHRDIKSGNLLFKKEYSKAGLFKKRTLMISDFGTAVFKDKVFGDLRTGTTGTPEWIPPEAWDIENQYDSSYDVWGLGLVLYHLAYRRLPWKHSRNDQTLLKDEIKFGPITFPLEPPISPEAKSIIELLLDHDPQKRPTTRELLISPLMQNIIRIVGNPSHFQENAGILAQASANHFHPHPVFSPPLRKVLPSSTSNSAERLNTGNAHSLAKSVKEIKEFKEIALAGVKTVSAATLAKRSDNATKLSSSNENKDRLHDRKLSSSSSSSHSLSSSQSGPSPRSPDLMPSMVALSCFVLKSTMFMRQCQPSSQDVVLLCICLSATCLCFINERKFYVGLSALEWLLITFLYSQGILHASSSLFWLIYTPFNLLAAMFIWFRLVR